MIVFDGLLNIGNERGTHPFIETQNLTVWGETGMFIVVEALSSGGFSVHLPAHS